MNIERLRENTCCLSQLEMLNNEGCEVYITGDINIDFFRFNTKNQTSENVSVE